MTAASISSARNDEAQIARTSAGHPKDETVTGEEALLKASESHLLTAAKSVLRLFLHVVRRPPTMRVWSLGG